jgi:hypothetical protein
MTQDPCIHPDNAPRTAYNKGCRCTRCKTQKRKQRQAEYQRNAQTYKNYRKTHPYTYIKPSNPSPKRVYASRPGCTHPELSPYTAWEYGCRCTECTRVLVAHRKRMRSTVLAKAKETMKTRARNAKVPMPSTPEQVHALLAVYIKRQILAQSGIRCHVDHITPLEHGGTHTADNVRILSEHQNLARRYAPDTECVALDLVTPDHWNLYHKTVKKLVYT